LKRLVTPLFWLWLLSTAGCAKKEPKPLRTEPWLAHPPASVSASAGSAAALTLTRYVLDQHSSIRFEIPTKHGLLSGTLSRVSGELAIDLSDLTRSRGSVRAELGSLDIHAEHGAAANDTTLLERARAALELPPDSQTPVFASFDLSSVEDAAPTSIEPAPERAPSATSPFSRRVHLTAVGNLLLHGFRVVRRAPLAAEFAFAADRQVPQSVLIRSRSPLVVSLETHAIAALAPGNAEKGPSAQPARVREARVTVELYGIKSN
jgi:hypothetical protein